MSSSMSCSDQPLHRSEFINQDIISNPEPCNFCESDINKLKSSDIFPPSCFIRAFDPKSRSDWYSESWICFPEYPFTIGLKYPFPPFFNEFFSVTGICYAQASPIIWRTLSVIQTIIDTHKISFEIPELSHSFNLLNSGSGFFVLRTKPYRKPLVFNVLNTDPDWKNRFFFVFRDSLPNGDLIPSSWVYEANLAKLAPTCRDTKNKVQKFLEIPEEERTFRYPKTSSEFPMPRSSKTGLQKPSALFTLEDIDNDAFFDEKITKENTQSCSQILHSIIKEKKSTDATKPNKSSVPFEKAFDHFFLGMEHVSECYLEKLKVIEAMDEIVAIKNKAAQDDANEIISLKKKIEEKEQLLVKAERNTAISVLETRITMANEASLPGFDASSWKSEIWKSKLAILKGQDS